MPLPQVLLFEAFRLVAGRLPAAGATRTLDFPLSLASANQVDPTTNADALVTCRLAF
jgi:hypothetical protein